MSNAALLEENAQLKETVTRLNRRCQKAEAAADAAQRRPGYRSFGRALLAWELVRAKERIRNLEEQLREERRMRDLGNKSP